MTIGINASFLRKPDSGTGQVTTNFLKTLMALNLTEHTFILYLEDDIDLQLPENFQKRIFLPPYTRDDLIRKIWWERYQLPQQVKSDGCEVLFSLYQSTTVLKDIRHIMLVHDTVWKVFPEYLNNLRKKLYYALVDRAIRKADQIVTVSQHSKADIKKYYEVDDEKITVSYIDCDPLYKQPVTEDEIKAVREKYQLPADYLLYIGGFDVRKNVDRVIEAYGSLLKESKNTPNLVLVGSFHPQLVPLVTDVPTKVKQILETVKAPEHKVKQPGFVAQSDLPSLYHGAKLFCYPSLYEGFGIPPLEAFNCHCPVVTSNVSSLKEIVDETCAIIVDPENTDSIAQAMKKGLTDEALRTTIIAGGLQRAQQFNWNTFTHSIVELLTQ